MDRRATRLIWLLIATMGALAAGFWWLRWAAPEPSISLDLRWWAILPLFVIAENVEARLEFRGELTSVNFLDIVLTIALASLGPRELLACVGSGVLVGVAMRRYGTPAKAAFSLASRLLETGLAVAVYGLIRGDAGPVAPISWVATLAATSAAALTAGAAVTLVISIANGRRERFASIASLVMMVTTGNTLLGLIALQVVWLNWSGVWMIAAAAVGLWFVYRSYFTLRQRYGSLNLLHGFSHALAGVTETDDVAATALKMAKELLRAEHAQLVFRLPEGAVVKQLDEHGTLTTAVHRVGNLPPVAELLGHDGLVLVPSDKQDDAQRALAEQLHVADLVAAPFTADGFEGVFVVAGRLSDVSTFDAEDAKVLETFAQNTGVALKVGELVDQLRREVADREFQALHDALTGLANRTRLHEVVDEMVAANPGNLVAVVLMDLDDFKEVNDTLGHTTGDALLEEIARRLTAAVSARGVVARLGGDEFAIASCCHRDVDSVLRFVDEIRSTVEEPYVVDRLSLAVRFSIGVSLSPEHGTDPKTLLQRADIAMYAAKAARTGVKLYAHELDTSSRRRLSLAGELGPSLEGREFQLFYQPQLDLKTGRVMAIEALARWPHPDHKSVPPDEFIPLVEQSGLIGAFTDWALETALRDIALWREEWPDMRVSVNMSARNLMEPGFSDVVAGHLARAGLSGEALTLELTESTVMSEPQHALGVLTALHALGIRIAIDDFGTGYSSLSYLKKLPVDEVKIDKSFVMNMVGDADDTAIVRSTIDLARSLGMDTVAEGVETVEAMEALAKLGCWAAQGYHLSRPLPSADIADKLRQLNRTYGGSLTITLSSDPGEDRLIHFGAPRR